MAVEGAFVNAAVTAFAGAVYGYVGARLARHKQSPATPLFMELVAFFLLLAAARQVAAAYENVELDRALFLALLVPAGYSVVPLVVVAARIRWENPVVARSLMFAFLVTMTIGLGFAYAGGITGPLTSAWGTDWKLNSLVARAMILLVMLVPGLVAGVYLILVGRNVTTPAGRRAVLLGWSCTVYYIVFTADALALAGLQLVLARLVTALAAILAYTAYRRAPVDETPARSP